MLSLSSRLPCNVSCSSLKLSQIVTSLRLFSNTSARTPSKTGKSICSSCSSTCLPNSAAASTPPLFTSLRISLPSLCTPQFLSSMHFTGGSCRLRTRAHFPAILKLSGKSLTPRHRISRLLVYVTFKTQLHDWCSLSSSFFTPLLTGELHPTTECEQECFCGWLELCWKVLIFRLQGLSLARTPIPACSCALSLLHAFTLQL